MSKQPRRIRKGASRPRHISVRSVHRDPPDLTKLSRALIALAMAQAEAEKQAQAQAEANGIAVSHPPAANEPQETDHD